MHQRFINELALQYELEQQKQQLELYSHQLEDLVAERTKELRKSEQWHKSVFENATEGIMVLDTKGVILNANARACEMFGFAKDELAGMHAGLLKPEESKELMQERMERILAGETLLIETPLYRKDGTKFFAEVSAKTIMIGEELFVQSFYRDITEKKKMQEQLYQSQKLESIGVLAGGIAHDFNNVLTAILGYTDIIRRATHSDKVVNGINVIESASRKAGRMISQLLGFARKSKQEIVPHNLNGVVHDTLKMLDRVIDRRIKVTLQLDENLPLVEADINQMEQVMMNLIINARDAMPQGGALTIKTTCEELTEPIPIPPTAIPPGRYVVLRVSDTGHGIPKEIRTKIFEPFFTTKDRDKGTGLGLSMVYGVVKEHRGYILVDSVVDCGTTFTVYLRASDKTVPVELPKPSATLQGTETILVVDDEMSVLTFMKEALEASGYTVFVANNPVSALNTFMTAHEEIALVITDLAMPVMNGRELIEKMKAIDPGVRVLEISAYSGSFPNSGRSPAEAYIQKPFESVQLVSTVRRIIDKDSSPNPPVNR